MMKKKVVSVADIEIDLIQSFTSSIKKVSSVGALIDIYEQYNSKINAMGKERIDTSNIINVIRERFIKKLSNYKKIPEKVIDYENEIYAQLTYIGQAFDAHMKIQKQKRVRTISDSEVKLPKSVIAEINNVQEKHLGEIIKFVIDKNGEIEIKKGRNILLKKKFRLCKWLISFFKDYPDIESINGYTLPKKQQIKFDFPVILKKMAPLTF